MFSKDEKDGFWDIEKLLPKKKSTLSPFSTKEKTVEHIIDGDVSENNGSGKLTLFDFREQKEEVRSVMQSGLIKKVMIKRFVDKYDFYGNFRKAALIYYDFKTPKSDFVPFYSYQPQYSQLNSEQKNFYFYWRDCVRRGKYIKTDYSYLYLYVYEILNLPEKTPANEGVKILAALWREYRRQLPNIDANMSLWLQDYCFIYGIPCPMSEIGDFVFEAIGGAEFKEFYLSDIEKMGKDGISAVLACLSDYDWRRGKYAGGENKNVYTEHLLSAMGGIVSMLWKSGKIFAESKETAILTRSAFRNSLCTHSVKCRLEIEYIPLSGAVGLRAGITAALRYTENKLRALLGVKSRLLVKDIPAEYANIIDKYFDEYFKKAEAERKRAEMPEYERLYDAIEDKLSFEGADEIERASWGTTARLVEDIEEDTDAVSAKREDSPALNELPDMAEKETAQTDEDADTYTLTDEEIRFVDAVFRSDTSLINGMAAVIGKPVSFVADRVNEAFSDGFGDVIIECIDDEYRIIEDYYEDIDKWLSKTLK